MVLLASLMSVGVATIAGPAVAATPAGVASYDVIIANGRIIDGTGSPWYRADVAFRNGRIAAIGNLASSSATQRVDAKGMVVAPGFINMLSQTDVQLLVDPRALSKIHQGITTDIIGEGESAGPLNEAIIKERQARYQQFNVIPDWRTLGEYFARLEHRGLGLNVGSYVGATSIREVVLGYENRTPNPAELDQMREVTARAMRDGALGLSTALLYPPAPYAKTEELIELAKVVAKSGGIYATHMRSEGNGIMTALDETFRIGREANIPLEIFHLKADGAKNWGTMPKIVARIEEARASGIDVAADTYAWSAWATPLTSFLPPWVGNGGLDQLLSRLKDRKTREKIRADMLRETHEWENEWELVPSPNAILIVSVKSAELSSIQGKRLDEVAKQWGTDPIDAMLDLLIKEPKTEVACFCMSEADVALALKQPWVSVGDDGFATPPDGPLGKIHQHPRAYATFPRVLRKYVREDRLLTLPEAIRKFTSLPAQRLHLAERGVLKLGMWADAVIFDPDVIADKATYTDPAQLSVGMQYVFVNGTAVIADAKVTGALPGQVLRGPGFQRLSE
jgi:dihydroorotase/N-acyl-D-amino-acid deacylase